MTKKFQSFFRAFVDLRHYQGVNNKERNGAKTAVTNCLQYTMTFYHATRSSVTSLEKDSEVQ